MRGGVTVPKIADYLPLIPSPNDDLFRNHSGKEDERDINHQHFFSLMKIGKRNLDFGDLLIYGGALVLFVWTMLKVLGIINTPLFVEMIPYFTGIAVIIGLGEKFLGMFNEINTLSNKVTALEGNMGDVKIDLKEMRHDFHTVEKDMAVVKHKLDLG